MKRPDRERLSEVLREGPYERRPKRQFLPGQEWQCKDEDERASRLGRGRGRGGLPTRDPPRRNMEKSGLLAQDTNTRNGVLVRHTVPLDARVPVNDWFVMCMRAEGDDKVEMTYKLSKKECWNIGSDMDIADLDLREPTMSKHHAVLCFRIKRTTGEICPYLMDLESTNGTRINQERLEPCRYYELLDRDCITFGDGEWDHIILKAPPLKNQNTKCDTTEDSGKLEADIIDPIPEPPRPARYGPHAGQEFAADLEFDVVT